MPLVRVRGRSMVPALRPGDFIWIKKTTTLVQRGNIVLLRSSSPNAEKSKFYLKRIIGLPGERLEIHSGRVSIDGKPLEERYVPSRAYLEPKPDHLFHIPSSHYIVLGDARDDSLDSRRFGPVSMQDILGVVLWRLWPPKLSL